MLESRRQERWWCVYDIRVHLIMLLVLLLLLLRHQANASCPCR